MFRSTDGQTGSGKSYSMMGYGEDRGLIPLTCSALFDRIEALQSLTLIITVEVGRYPSGEYDI